VRESTPRKFLGCSKALTKRHKIKFCSNKCQHDLNYRNFIERWKSGFVVGNVGIGTRVMSRHIRRYLLEKYSYKCSKCGWGEKNPLSGRLTLEIDHIDGDAENNKEVNLRLLCPNCHSLTPHFRNLNKGRGRKWRMERIKLKI
jgi:hypothetical protein